MGKLLGLLCLVGFVCLGEALTKKEVFNIIHDYGDEIRQEYISLIKSKIKGAFEKATSPQATICINGYVSTTYKDLNTIIAAKLNQIRSEYKTKTADEYEDMTEDDLKKDIEEKVRPDVKFIPEKVEQIMACTEQEI